jgi:hypothetical protein
MSAPTDKQLRETIKLMDCLAQSGFSEISSIAKLALSYLETPDGYRHIDNIANALVAIWDAQHFVTGHNKYCP